MPRFVILEHDHPILHWDFMLESGEVLRTWRLAAPPRPGADFSAAPSFDHRRVYLDYEGPISGATLQIDRNNGDIGLSAQFNKAFSGWVGYSGRFGDDSQKYNSVNLGVKVGF